MPFSITFANSFVFDCYAPNNTQGYSIWFIRKGHQFSRGWGQQVGLSALTDWLSVSSSCRRNGIVARTERFYNIGLVRIVGKQQQGRWFSIRNQEMTNVMVKSYSLQIDFNECLHLFNFNKFNAIPHCKYIRRYRLMCLMEIIHLKKLSICCISTTIKKMTFTPPTYNTNR